MTIDFGSICEICEGIENASCDLVDDFENANIDLRRRVRDMCDEAEEIQTNYDELLECLGATDHTSALDAIRAMKDALPGVSQLLPLVAAPVVIEPTIKFSDSTSLTHAELTTIITQSLSKAIDEFKATTPAVKKVRTFSDIAGVN
jgi:hypothetical protein